MHNLHPDVFFGYVNGVLRICTRCKFAPTFEVEQIYLHPVAPGCKMCICTQNGYFLYVSIGDFDILQTFSVYIRFCLKRY